MLNKEDYLQELNSILNGSTKFGLTVTRDPTKNLKKKVNQLINILNSDLKGTFYCIEFIVLDRSGPC